MVRCVERLRLARAYEDADREFQVAHEALMNSQGPAFRNEARSNVKLAQKKREACRAEQRTHEIDHECAALTLSA